MPWDDLRTIIDDPPVIQPRVDCPVCAAILVFNGRLKLWSCPRWGKRHYQAAQLPRD